MRKFWSQVVLSIGLFFVCGAIFARGGYQPTEEEYKTWRGENRTTKIGNKWVVPRLVKRNMESDQKVIKSILSDFKLGKVSYRVDVSPKGYILSQTPEAGALKDKPGTIDIVVSKGP